MDRIKSIAVPVKARSGAGRKPAKPAPDTDNLPFIAGFHREPMPTTARPTHRYHVGERLVMSRGSRDIARAASMCEVLAIVPHEVGPLRYRVRSDNESYERIVDEIDLAPVR